MHVLRVAPVLDVAVRRRELLDDDSLAGVTQGDQVQDVISFGDAEDRATSLRSTEPMMQPPSPRSTAPSRMFWIASPSSTPNDWASVLSPRTAM